MIWILGVGTLLLSASIAAGFWWMVNSHKTTLEAVLSASKETAQTLLAATEATFKHLKEASPIGGLPRDLWLEQHRLREREMDLRERQLDIETPLRQAALKAKLLKAHKISGNGRLTNPEG